MVNQKSENTLESMKYEEAMQRLQEIVSLLENGEANLDESLSLFEEGTKLSTFCYKKLNEAEQRIENFSKGDGAENE